MATDPIQGLIDYVNETKPYHTKILEVAVAYAQNEDLDISFDEDLVLDISLLYPAFADEDNVPLRTCPEGYGILWDRPSPYIVVDASVSPQTISLEGDHTLVFNEGTRFEIREPQTGDEQVAIVDAIVLIAESSTGSPAEQAAITTDLETFSLQKTPAITLRHLTYSLSLDRFVAQDFRDDIAYSDDGGQTWTHVPNAIGVDATTDRTHIIEWVEDLGLFIAATTGGSETVRMSTSVDGVTWSGSPSHFTSSIFTVPRNAAYIEDTGLFYVWATHFSGERIRTFYTADGINWNTGTVDVNPSIQPSGFMAAYSPDLSLFVGIRGRRSPPTVLPAVYHSTNGFDWTFISTLPEVSDGLFFPNPSNSLIDWVPTIKKFVFIGNEDEGQNNIMAMSSDGFNWEVPGGGGSPSLLPHVNWRMLKYVPAVDKIVALANDLMYISDDFETWEEVALPTPSSADWYDLEIGGVTFFTPDPGTSQFNVNDVLYDSDIDDTVLGVTSLGSPLISGNEFFFPLYEAGSFSNGDVYVIYDVVETNSLNIFTRPNQYYGSPAFGSPFGSPIPGSPQLIIIGSPGTYPNFGSPNNTIGNTIVIKSTTPSLFSYGKEVEIRNATESIINKTYNIYSSRDLGGSPNLIELTVLDPVLADTTFDGELLFTAIGWSGGGYCSDIPPEFLQSHWIEDLDLDWFFAESPLEPAFQHFILEADSSNNTFTVEGDARYILSEFGSGSPLTFTATVQHSINPGSPISLNANNGEHAIESITFDHIANRSIIQVQSVTDDFPTGWVAGTTPAPVEEIISPLCDPNNWEDESSVSPPEQWEAVMSDERYWWDDGGGFAANPGVVTYIGADPLPAEIVFNYEVVNSPDGSTSLIWKNGSEAEQAVELGISSGQIVVPISEPTGSFYWGISGTTEYFGVIAVNGDC